MPFDHNVFLRVRLGDEGEANISQQVVRVDIEDVDRGSDKATILMDNQGHANVDAVREGAQVRIDMGWETEYAFLFHGRIESVRAQARSGGTGRVRVTCFDLSARLNVRPSQPGRQHEGTLQEIVTALAAEGDIPMGDVSVDPMPSWPMDGQPLNQQNMTAWQLIQSLAEEYRARAFVEVNGEPGDNEAAREAGGEAKLYFMSEAALLAQDPLGRLVYCHGFGQLIEFDYTREASGAAPSSDITVADPETGAAVNETGADPAADDPAALTSGQNAQMERVLGESRAADADAAVTVANAASEQPADLRARQREAGAPSDPALARRRIEQDKTRILGFNGTGTTNGSIFLRAKGSVEIEGLSSTAAGRWYLKRVNHIIERSRLEEEVQSTYRTKFVATR